MDEKNEDLVLKYVLSSGKPVSRRDVCAALGISESTAARYLSDLSSAGRIQRSGEGRATVYLADAADSYLSRRQASDDRLPIEYDFDRIRAYSTGSSFFNAQQKAELIEHGSLQKSVTHDEYLLSVHKKLLVEASWASSALEGNTYSLIDTQELFERGIEMTGAGIEETQMLLNHKHAIEYTLSNINDIGISRRDIINIHALLSEGLMKDPADVGKIRSRAVGVGQSTYRPIDVPSILSEEFDVMIQVANEINDPFEQSFFLLANIAYLQPFADVNKRTSRMVSNIPLLKSGMMPMSFYQMSRSGYEKGMLHYYETGDFRRLAKEYLDCYKISARRFKELIDNKPSQRDLELRLKYRHAISTAVFDVVRNGKALEDTVPPGIRDDERHFFIEYTRKIMDGLSEGNALLYKLTDSDISTWRSSNAAASRKPRP